VQACYQSVPVTEYHEVRQTVQRPVVEEKYVDREFTEYQPVTEERFAEVPTVNYVTVTENQTCTRDMGGWQTYQQCHPKMAPCQYDPRPGFIGAWNRAGYRIRSAFTPSVTTHRQYVPNIVAYNVPVQRQVAQYGTRKVAYNVTKMVPTTTTRKVAVRTVRYVSEEIVRQHPVTVMRQVPIGSTIAFGGPIGGGSQTALASPTPDPISGERTADRENDEFGNAPKKFSRESSNIKKTNDVRPMNYLVPQQKDESAAEPAAAPPVDPQAKRTRVVPTIVRVGQWTAARRPSVLDAAPVKAPAISVADSAQ
jgi:hypothetical protein